ncbi:hypothetical protein D3C75_886340 [compost metagenome]
MRGRHTSITECDVERSGASAQNEKTQHHEFPMKKGAGLPGPVLQLSAKNRGLEPLVADRDRSRCQLGSENGECGAVIELHDDPLA